VSSLHKLTGKNLIFSNDQLNLGRLLYEAPFVVLAHDKSDDPVFFYGNLKAQEVFEMTWAELIHLPSRYSAEFANQAARQHLLDEVALNGFIDNYSGTRISKTGRKFQIQNATVWNLINQDSQNIGQAASFYNIASV
jgi:MEKHLA domain